MCGVSIVVPVCNERDNLEKLVEKIESAMGGERTPSWELILVDDGSTDGSDAVMTALARERPHLRHLHFTCNQGQTAAMDAGIRAARGTYVVTMDADLQNDPADIPNLLDHMEEGIGCVAGVRTKRRDNWLRRVSSRFANWVRNKLSNENITDTGCSLKVFRRACFDRIQLFEGLHRFLPTLVKMEGYRVVEVPVRHHPRHAGESKYGVWNRVFKSLWDLLAVRWMKRRHLRYEFRQPGDSSK